MTPRISFQGFSTAAAGADFCTACLQSAVERFPPNGRESFVMGCRFDAGGTRCTRCEASGAECLTPAGLMVGDFVDFYRAVWWYNELVADAYYDVDTDSDRTVTDGSSSYDDGSSTDDDGSSTDGGSSTEDGSSASDEYGSSTDDGGHFSDDGSHFSDDEDKPTWSRSVRIAAGLALETLGVTLYRVEQTHRAHYALPVQQQGWRLLPRGVRPAHQREAIAAYDALVEARRALTVRRHSEVHTSFEARLATSLPRLLPGDAQYAAWAVAVRAFNRQIHLADDGAWLFDRVWKGLPKAWEDPEGEEVNVDHDIC